MMQTQPSPADGWPALRVDPGAVAQLQARLRGPLLRPGDAAYDAARRVYNAMIDRHPALVARCADVADVMATVDFAREHEVTLAVRGGGHNAGGLGVVDDGLVLDLSAMRSVRVDPAARTVRVEGGCLWRDVDHATHAFGLAVPSGAISTTGVGGLTLGGGHGYLTRRYGLTIDSLLAADVVLADGSLVTASADTHPDLFWALRGGGGNFGVVTSFLFRAHPVRTVLAGPTLWPLEQAAEVMAWYRDFLPRAPEELYGFLSLMTVPAGPPFPASLQGRRACGVVWCSLGDPEAAEAALGPLRALPPPAFSGVQTLPYPAMQSMFDTLYPPGHQWYWRGDFFRELPDEAIRRHLDFTERMPSPQSTMHLYPIDGAVHRVRPEETAFRYRDVRWSAVFVGVDPDPSLAPRLRQWVREYWEALHPFSAGGGYVNFLHDEGQERVQATYGDNYPRLAQVKARYDPDNLFHVNQNVRPHH